MIQFRRLRWNNWNIEHIARHGVTPEEVEEACLSDFLVLIGKKGRVLLLGLSQAGRMLAVVLHDEGEGVYYPVTARSASRKERRQYRATKEGGRSTL